MKRFILIRVFAVFIIVIAVSIGAGLGLSLAETVNIKNQENFVEFAPALPTKILDINGNLITEFSADEKRELISLSELPRHLIYAVLAREDPDFYNHKGFSIRGIARAFFGQISGRSLGGGSTITQQVAGTLYTDRTEKSYSRKIRELWWAIQMERRYTKNEILEIYLNYMYMGPGVYGVEAASKYFFGHSAREITLAEAAVLVIQLSSPARYNPLDNPNIAMDRQRSVLNKMIELGYTTAEDADASFNEYWDSYDYTRASTSAYFNREDKAPWFSEYVRRELDRLMYGTMDYYRDGYTVLTTLDLDFQNAAEKYMAQGLSKANKEYARSEGTRLIQAERTYLPIIDLLSLTFNLNPIHATSDAQNEQKAGSRYTKVINPVVDLAALMFGIQDLKLLTNYGYADLKNATEKNVIEGALITLENETGYIKAIVGGSKYDESNQLIRATQGKIMPGSSFKPLYYSAAIDLKKFTPSTLIHDLPMVFHNEDGTPYIPLNFRGEWKGSVLLYNALAQSMNVPSLKVLDAIGFDAAIDRAALLLGIDDPDVKRRTFPRVYPMGLGIIAIAPIQMARAFAVFANQGRDVSPIAIRSIEDRNGRVVMDIERDIRQKQRHMGGDVQVISPQNAYVMTSLLKKTVEMGTLQSGSGYGSKFTFRDEQGARYRIAAAGKTGTTQNWSDAWTVGFTPYYTTAIWFGFDKPGNSLGLNLTGATLAGPVWGDYMREIHLGLPARDFLRPSAGVIETTVCSESGLLVTSACPGSVTLSFLQGTQPTSYCDIHVGGAAGSSIASIGSMRLDTLSINENTLLGDLKMPELSADILSVLGPLENQNRQGNNRNNRRNNSPQNNRQGQNNPGNTALPEKDYNSILEGYDGMGEFNTRQPDRPPPQTRIPVPSPNPVPPTPGQGSAEELRSEDLWSEDRSAPQEDYGLEFQQGENGLIPDYNPLLD
ncbi:MAG: PBP1A family penicillin-binding protein [Treponema sp.]|jgi:penicillin-binding protein 1A|nr:PBP1A family penicillin-binding protein [Treponema sp.]